MSSTQVAKKGRPPLVTHEAVAAILDLYKSGIESAVKIGNTLNLSHDTVLRILKKNGIKPQPGGSRPDTGKRYNCTDAEVEIMRRQQIIDSKTNSWEVGLGRKYIDDEAWIKSAGTAFKQTRRGYSRDNDKLNITVSGESLGIPLRLPRVLPWPRM